MKTLVVLMVMTQWTTEMAQIVTALPTREGNSALSEDEEGNLMKMLHIEYFKQNLLSQLGLDEVPRPMGPFMPPPQHLLREVEELNARRFARYEDEKIQKQSEGTTGGPGHTIYAQGRKLNSF